MSGLAGLPYDANMQVIVWSMYLVAAVLYCAPMLIAFARNVEYKWGLYAGNLLLGWTGVGWAYALYYAVFADKEGTHRERLSLARVAGPHSARG
ncbi:superinfection immunity protein [Rhodopseudomonas palustris]|uniref:Superinfection immunity protein n=1 Tax=Rhodopseudomonas palustris (strain DX-1) TaxID=652103 RepID=E6VEZ8_RHOPX|nr:superinfection immunity protein [Rhodopseudomonas palustris]QDL99176.1 superinfection immunity protein [Rhodopseudomonas palustris]